MGLTLLSLVAATIAAAASPAPPSPWQAFLDECEAAGRRLWGRSLCAPVVVVDQRSGTHRASEPEPGPLPAIRANTAFEWGGKRWLMVLEPLPTDLAQARELIFHEAWHVHQKELGLPPNNAVAGHLDGWRARYLLRMEWQALGAALQSRGRARRRHVAQALAFRAQRLGLKGADALSERDQMRHEGLAAYTGTVLSGDPVRLALLGILDGPRRPSLGRSFAYVSGPAWGLLLDDLAPGWRGRLKEGTDLPELMPVAAAAVALPDSYGGSVVLAQESKAGLERELAIAAAMAATSEETGLRLPLSEMSMSFDPNRVSTGPDGSLIYHRITLRDRWGRLQVEGVGIRFRPDFKTAFAAWPLPPGALELAPGWRVRERQGGGAWLEAAAE